MGNGKKKTGIHIPKLRVGQYLFFSISVTVLKFHGPAVNS